MGEIITKSHICQVLPTYSSLPKNGLISFLIASMKWELYNPHFIEKETEASRDYGKQIKDTRTQKEAEWACEPAWSDSKATFLLVASTGTWDLSRITLSFSLLICSMKIKVYLVGLLKDKVSGDHPLKTASHWQFTSTGIMIINSITSLYKYFLITYYVLALS